LTSEELAEHVEAFIVAAVTRVRGPGDDQYSNGDRQAFEGRTLDEQFDELRDELYDVANYAVMLNIKVERLQQEIAAVVRAAGEVTNASE